MLALSASKAEAAHLHCGEGGHLPGDPTCGFLRVNGLGFRLWLRTSGLANGLGAWGLRCVAGFPQNIVEPETDRGIR